MKPLLINVTGGILGVSFWVLYRLTLGPLFMP